MCVECFTERTSRSNALHSVVKEPPWANVESFQRLPFDAQSYRSILPYSRGKQQDTPYIPTPKGGGFTAFFR